MSLGKGQRGGYDTAGLTDPDSRGIMATEGDRKEEDSLKEVVKVKRRLNHLVQIGPSMTPNPQERRCVIP